LLLFLKRIKFLSLWSVSKNEKISHKKIPHGLVGQDLRLRKARVRFPVRELFLKNIYFFVCTPVFLHYLEKESSWRADSGTPLLLHESQKGERGR
jgi:hypothetical protein